MTYRTIKNHIRRRLPRAGKIRLGITTKTQGGKEYPKEVDHFVFDDDLPGRAEIIDAFAPKKDGKVVGPVRRMLVTFHSDEIEDVFPLAFKLYSTGGLMCTGNGEEAQRAVTRDETFVTGEGQKRTRKVLQVDKMGRPIYEPYKPCVCPLFTGEGGQRKMCKAIGNLMVTIPFAAMRVYQIDTGSWHSAQNIVNQLTTFRDMFGGIRGRLFVLTRVPIVTQGGGKSVTHYPLSIEMPSMAEQVDANAKVKRLADGYRMPVALPAGVTVEPETPTVEEDIVREDRVEVEVVQSPAPEAEASPEADGEVGPPVEEYDPEPADGGEYGEPEAPAPAPTPKPAAAKPSAKAARLLSLVCQACGNCFSMGAIPSECPDCGATGTVGPVQEPPPAEAPKRPSAARRSLSPDTAKAAARDLGPAPARQPAPTAPPAKPADDDPVDMFS